MAGAGVEDMGAGSAAEGVEASSGGKETDWACASVLKAPTGAATAARLGLGLGMGLGAGGLAGEGEKAAGDLGSGATTASGIWGMSGPGLEVVGLTKR